MTRLNLSLRARTGKAYVAQLRRQVISVHSHLDSPLTELSIALLDDGQMSLLHRRYLKIPGPTDVLTFPLESDSAGRIVSGEIAIGVAQARRSAAERDVSVRHELLLYAVHGMLHLHGFDDKNARDFRRMHAAEDAILTQLGIGPIFHRPLTRGRRSKRGR